MQNYKVQMNKQNVVNVRWTWKVETYFHTIPFSHNSPVSFHMFGMP